MALSVVWQRQQGQLQDSLISEATQGTSLEIANDKYLHDEAV
jgi:hypothetical protein